jgi:hypothetical protein
MTNVSDRLSAANVQNAVADHDNKPVVDWVLGLLSLQGISDQAAFSFDQKHGGIRSHEIESGLRHNPSCSLLDSYWVFNGCCYRKSTRSCAEPSLLPACPLPRHDLRKGALNVASYGMYFFVRDVCGGDLIGWIDSRLAEADPGRGRPRRAEQMRQAVLGLLSYVPNIGPKLWSMILADLLLGGDPTRERWVHVGAYMVAIDSLLHNFLYRTGILRRCDAEHAYGPACFQPHGCAEVVEALAQQIDAREFNPAFPSVFPRLIQHAIWQFCATGERNICNGVQIDDRKRCRQTTCPTFQACDRISLR